MIDVATKFVTVQIYQLDPGDLPGVARVAKLVAEERAPTINGFIQCVIMANEQKTQMLIVSLWESREAWSAAQWDDELGRVVAEEVETSTAFDFKTYEPITIVRAATSP